MGDLYASAIGTTVLQLKEIPDRPSYFDGKVCLFDLASGVDEAAVLASLGRYGPIVGCTFGDPVVVHFATHEAARSAVREAGRLVSIAGGVDTLYNEREYDRRGWCVFESSVSGEAVLRLNGKFPRAEAALRSLGPKVLSLTGASPPEAADLAGREGHVEEVVRSIEEATFTGKGDKGRVIRMYKDYAARIAESLLKSLLVDMGDSSQGAAPPTPAEGATM